MGKIVCQCGKHIDVDFPDFIDLDKEQGKLESILSGNFMTAECPECQNLLKPELPVHLACGSRHLDLFLVPETERKKALGGELPYPIPQGAQIVIGYAELVEGLALAGENLDARAVEILKYFLLKQAIESAESGGQIRIRFEKIEEDKLVFHIHGMRQDEVGIFKVPVATYEKALSGMSEHLEQEPLADVLKPPYISVNKIFQEH